MPSGVQSTMDGTLVEVVGERARRAAVGRNDGKAGVDGKGPLAAHRGLEKTICVPSGDQCGPLSGPGCETIFVDASSARLST